MKYFNDHSFVCDTETQLCSAVNVSNSQLNGSGGDVCVAKCVAKLIIAYSPKYILETLTGLQNG